MLTSDVLHGTSMRQSINSSVSALLKGKLRSSMFQIFCTDGCIFIGQIQLRALRFTGQGISYYVQQSLPVHYSDGQLIHMFKPTCLMSTKIRLSKYMLPRFIISIYCDQYTINVTLPLLVCYKYCKKFTVRNQVVPFLWRVLVQHVCYRV